MKHILLILLLCQIWCEPAYAHRFYIIEDSRIDAPDGSPLIVERLYGDGIIGMDPVSLQIRNLGGAVLAHSQTSTHVATFCPHINYCWAFPYNPILPLSMGLRLDTSNVDWNTPPPVYTLSKEEAGEFSAYLAGHRRIAHSDSFGYPSTVRDKSPLFIPSFASLLISPAIILFDQADKVFIIMFACILPVLIYRYIYQAQKRRAIKTAGIILSILTGLCSCALIIVLTGLFGTPLLCTLVAIFTAKHILKYIQRIHPSASLNSH